MNDCKSLQWMIGLWLTVLILAGCHQRVPANVFGIPLSLIATTHPPTVTSISAPPLSTPARPASTPPSNSTLPPSDTRALISSELTASNLIQPDGSNGSAWRTYTTTHGLADDYVTAIAVDPAGHKWFGTHVGLSQFDGQGWRTYTTADGLADNHIAAIAVDPAGPIWVGTANGLSVFDGQNWRTYTTGHGLPHNHITAIAVDPAGPVWVGTYGSGVSEFDGRSWRTYTTADGLAHNQVKAIAVDPAGHKWFATFGAAQFEGAGVSEFDGRSWRTYTTADGLAHNWVNAIAVDAAGHKWFGTEGGGVSKFDGATWTTYTAADGLAGNVVYAIAPDQTGKLWFGTSGGLSKLTLNEGEPVDATSWTSYTKRDGLPHQPVYSLALDQAGRKWLAYSRVGFFIDIAGSPVFPFEGNGGGVSVFDDGEWTPVPTVLPVVAAIPVTPTQSLSLDEFGPRLIDATSEQLYTGGYVDGIDQPQTLALNLTDERFLARYDLAGGLALDEAHGRLYVDQYNNAGLAVVNTRAGRLERVILMPGRDSYGSPLPQADPFSGHVLVFRDNVVYIADPERGAIINTAAFEVINYIQEIAPIERSLYDPATRLLYLTFVVHGCTSSMGGDCSTRKVVVYDLAAGQEVTCDNSRLGTVVGSYLSCTNFNCSGPMCNGWVSVWGGSRPWFDSTGWSDQESRVAFDASRQLFYEVAAGQLKVYDAERLTLALALPRPITGTFERYEAKTDTLQFRVNGQLQAWPANAIRPPAPEPLVASPVPTTPVQFLAVTPAWPADQTLFGTWLDPTSISDYNRLFTCNSLFYISRDGGQSWGQSQGGLAGSCGLNWPSLAISPDYTRDQTLLAGVQDMGILKSTDGGQLWRPSGVSLPDRFTRKILLSPGFAADETAFAMAGYYSYRSTDGGQTWQILGSPSSAQPGQWQDLALSAEFDRDQIILGSLRDNQRARARLFISRDAGEQWVEVGEMPEEATTLSLAPLFATWQTVFAYDSYNLYRSTDGGRQWEPVLTIQDGWIKHLIYAPDIEQNRPMFVLSALTDQTISRSVESNRLYRSNDGGQTWQPFELPAGVIPTAVTISPNFAQDRTLFIGTANGQVLMLEVAE